MLRLSLGPGWSSDLLLSAWHCPPCLWVCHYHTSCPSKLHRCLLVSSPFTSCDLAQEPDQSLTSRDGSSHCSLILLQHLCKQYAFKQQHTQQLSASTRCPSVLNGEALIFPRQRSEPELPPGLFLFSRGGMAVGDVIYPCFQMLGLAVV